MYVAEKNKWPRLILKTETGSEVPTRVHVTFSAPVYSRGIETEFSFLWYFFGSN